MLNSTILRLYQSLQNVIPQAAGIGAYTLVQNRLALHPHIQAMQAAEKPTEAMKDFEKRRLDLCREYADKDPETDKPLIKDNRYVIDETSHKGIEFREKYDALLEETNYEEISNKHKAEFMKVLNMETDVTLKPVVFEQLPADISGADIEVFIEAGLILQEPAMQLVGKSPVKAKKKSKTRFQ